MVSLKIVSLSLNYDFDYFLEIEPKQVHHARHDTVGLLRWNTSIVSF